MQNLKILYLLWGLEQLQILDQCLLNKYKRIIHTVAHNQRDFFINELGFDEYIEKPIRYEDIERAKKHLNKIKLLCKY